jgi:hypothetical protein
MCFAWMRFLAEIAPLHRSHLTEEGAVRLQRATEPLFTGSSTLTAFSLLQTNEKSFK